jgi:hypothetical protein
MKLVTFIEVGSGNSSSELENAWACQETKKQLPHGAHRSIPIRDFTGEVVGRNDSVIDEFLNRVERS